MLAARYTRRRARAAGDVLISHVSEPGNVKSKRWRVDGMAAAAAEGVCLFIFFLSFFYPANHAFRPPPPCTYPVYSTPNPATAVRQDEINLTESTQTTPGGATSNAVATHTGTRIRL